MSDTTTLPSGESALSVSEAVAQMRAGREQAASQDEERNEFSEAARKLNQAKAAKRQQQEQPEEDSEDVVDEEDYETEETQDDEAEESEEDFEEDQAEEDDGESEGEDEEPTAIEVDGKLWTADEIKSGAMMQADYTRKTQQLAQQAKAFEAETLQRLQKLDELLTTFQPDPEPDWTKEAMEDPDWQLRKLQYDQQQAKRKEALEILRNHQEQGLRQAQQATVQELTGGDYNPDWKDPNKFQNDLGDIEAYALKLGATPEDVAAFYQPWHIKVFDKAMRYDQRNGKLDTAKKKVVNKPKPVKSKSRSGLKSGVSRAIERAQAAFNENPSIENGKALMRAQRQSQRKS